MMSCCSKPPQKPSEGPRACKDAVRYVERQRAEGPKVAVVSCEGACVKGEVARLAANLLTSRLEPARSARICLGEALTGDSGMRDLVAQAPRVVVIEGCGLKCATRLLAERLPGTRVDPIVASGFYEYDRTRCFEVLDMPEAELRGHAEHVAAQVRSAAFDDGAGKAAPCG